MENTSELITDKQMDIAFGNANFGNGFTKREIVANTLLKCASGYHTGHTAECIAKELGLIYKSKWQLTNKGKQYLYAAYATGKSV